MSSPTPSARSPTRRPPHQGTVKQEVLEARKRGVKFDIGHGKGSFAFKTARAMLANGFLPDTISSDVHTLCINGPAFDQVTTLSKFLCLGMPLNDVIAATTVNAAHGPEAARARQPQARQRRRRHRAHRSGRAASTMSTWSASTSKATARSTRRASSSPAAGGIRGRRDLVPSPHSSWERVRVRGQKLARRSLLPLTSP